MMFFAALLPCCDALLPGAPPRRIGFWSNFILKLLQLTRRRQPPQRGVDSAENHIFRLNEHFEM